MTIVTASRMDVYERVTARILAELEQGVRQAGPAKPTSIQAPSTAKPTNLKAAFAAAMHPMPSPRQKRHKSTGRTDNLQLPLHPSAHTITRTLLGTPIALAGSFLLRPTKNTRHR